MTLDFDPPAGAIVGATLILFNGPPYSGKDTAGKCLLPLIRDSMILKMAGALKKSTHIDFGMPDDLPDDAFELCKDDPHPAFFGMTPRAAYIQKSEERQKPFLGKDIYGKTAVRRLWREYQTGKRVFFVTDSGFFDEVSPLLGVIPKDDTLLVRIHAENRGCDFKKDSRSYIELPGVATYDVENNTSEADFRVRIMNLVIPFIGMRTIRATER